MRAVMVMFDSLNRHMLPPYGCDWVKAPNFRRLAERTATFDNMYVGSMPCMPARREIHTGRYNFLHRSWGPLEPFDDSMPQMLKENGVYTHLTSDHHHYWEDGGCTYHTRYSSWEAHRGQEGDPWKGQVGEPETPQAVNDRSGGMWRQDWINRQFMPTEDDQPQARTFASGVDFIRRNHADDNWFLQIETFDPHEPFFTHQGYKDLYAHEYNGPHFDWPDYRPVREKAEQIAHVRYEYAALVSMCDRHLGKVLDAMDELEMWDDTMLIVNTDHGYLLGEHGAWAKCWCPLYGEVAHSPLLIWDPRSGVRGERRESLVQTIDLAPTLLEFFGVDRAPDMQGAVLRQTIADDTPVRQAGLFGIHGHHVNVTDGRYVYMRGRDDRPNSPLYNYTLMPTNMRQMFPVEQLKTAELVGPLSFTKGCPVLRMEQSQFMWPADGDYPTMLFDLHSDPEQSGPIDDPRAERMMIDHLVRLMRENDAPPEQFVRLGLEDA